MAGPEVLQQRGDRNPFDVLYIMVTVDGEVDDGQKRIGVYLVFLTDLFYGLVAEP